MLNHNSFRKLRNFSAGFSIISVMGIVFAFISHFHSLPQGTTFIGVIVDVNFYSSIAFSIMLFFVIAWIVFQLFLFYLSRIEPDIKIDKLHVGNRAFITIQNCETVAVEHVSVKIIDFRYNNSSNDVENFSKTKSFSTGLNEIGRKIIPNSPPINVLIAQGLGLKYTEFFIDDENHRHIQDLRSDKNSSWNKYNMVFQIFGQLTDEKENRLLGTYKGTLTHINHFPQNEGEVIIDNLVWNNFEKITAKGFGQ